ncbi:hypothetical protein FRC03_008217 [Tulasnella sp. 419]|nr:hypothetical protein FRC03_008217 [Tulasnella sp. 419]
MTSTKLYIKHPIEKDSTLVGVLHQVDQQNKSTQGKPIALILHGYLGHKDYLFQKKLALQLPIDSFRFDFRGNHESTGSWALSGLFEDLQDIEAVVSHLKSEYGYHVDMVVAHSRATVSAFRWVCFTPEGRATKRLVNVSGRYRFEIARPVLEKLHIPDPILGYSITKAKVAGEYREWKVYPEDIDRFSSYDASFIWKEFPQETDVLTLHGMSDTVVPPYDATCFARALSGRAPGTHSLHYIEDCDHNFIGVSAGLIVYLRFPTADLIPHEAHW